MRRYKKLHMLVYKRPGRSNLAGEMADLLKSHETLLIHGLQKWVTC